MIQNIFDFIKKNESLLFKILAIWLVVSLIIIFNQKEEIENKEFRIENLDDQNETLSKKNSELESEKEELKEDNYTYSNENASENYKSYNTTNYTNSTQNTISDEEVYLSKGSAVVVFKMKNCDYFILENNSGYIIAQWMGSNDPDQGDHLAGDFNRFGTDTFYNITRSTKSRLWIDNYMLSKDSALEKITEKCD